MEPKSILVLAPLLSTAEKLMLGLGSFIHAKN
jgi:hypothetical protein